ncbi:MAG TPA: CBS domain-containing protein [Phaeodactylibacter sp.]|nr:CBS domain-containing protein [Phaeodactylibacter sp.]
MKEKLIPVAELMTRDLIIVYPEDNLERVADIFRSHHLHHLPVVDSEGNLQGILSKTDFLSVNHFLAVFDDNRFSELMKRLYRSIKVKEVMNDKVVTIESHEPVSIAADIFRENLFHALPVVEDGKLVGMLTTYDLLNYCFRDPALLAAAERAFRGE